MVSIFQSVLFHCSNKSLIAHAADKSQSLMQKERKKFFFNLCRLFQFFASRPYLKVRTMVENSPHYPKVQGSTPAPPPRFLGVRVHKGGLWAYLTPPPGPPSPFYLG
jgi:hypothetical protein